MDGIRNAQAWFDHWRAYLDYCFNVAPASAICEGFWNYSLAGFITLGFLVLLYVLVKYLSYRRKYRAAMIAQWEREQVDEAGIAERRWNGDKAYQAELPDAEVLDRIRSGIQQRRREVGSPEPQK